MYVGQPNKSKRTGSSSPVSAAHFNVLLLHSRVQYTAPRVLINFLLIVRTFTTAMG